MEISQHIKNLLITKDRVILGGFGAFDSKHIPASIDKETKTMTPPQKIIVFNPEFTQDEGILAKEMAEKEGISLESANEQISEYVKTIKTKLDAGEKVVFKDLGEFRKEGDKYEFSYLSKDNLLVDSFGLPKVSLSEQDKKNIPPKKDIRKEPLKTVKKDKPKPTPKTTVKKEVKKKPVKKQKQVKTQKEKKKKKLFWPVFLIIIGLIGILLVAVYFFKPELWKKGYGYSSEKIAMVKSKIFGNKKDDLEVITPEDVGIQTDEEIADTSASDNQNEEIAEDTVNTEEVAEDNIEDNTEEVQNNNQNEEVAESNNEVTEDNTNTQEVTVNNNTNNATSGKYYIIIGSVKTKAAADKEQKRYAAKGITTSILYAEKLDRYRISIGEFSSAKAAQDFFTEFQNKHGSIDAWVWEKR